MSDIYLDAHAPDGMSLERRRLWAVAQAIVDVEAAIRDADAKHGTNAELPQLLGPSPYYGCAGTILVRETVECRTRAGNLSWGDILVEEVCEALDCHAPDGSLDVAAYRSELVQIAATAVRAMAALPPANPQFANGGIADPPAADVAVKGAVASRPSFTQRRVVVPAGEVPITVTIPEALSTEDDGIWWIAGHVHPAFALLGVVRQLLLDSDVDPGLIVHELLGGPRRDGSFTVGSPDYSWTLDQQVEHFDGLINRIEYGWFKPFPGADNGEAVAVRAQPWESDAEAWTIVRTGDPS